MRLDNNELAFFELVRAGLWEKEARLALFGKIDFQEVFRLAEEQSVTGLITAGLEHIVDVKAPQEDVLQFVGSTLQLEQQNMAMNEFVGNLIEKLRKEDIYTLLIKGQGIAQCYERPLWRDSGDVDLLLSEDNYKKAVDCLTPVATDIEKEYKYNMHQAMTIESWVIELHGNLHCGLSRKIDKGLKQIKNDIFYGGSVRSWLNGKTQMFLLGANNDAIYLFTHFLNHFYKGGVGIRQICDWCRLLWTFKDSLNHGLLESQIRKMGLVSEWKAFGAFAVEYLGMPSDAMPFYDPAEKWRRKADKICKFVMAVGNMGHNRDMSYYSKYPFMVRKVCSMGRRCSDLIRHTRIFPMDSFRFFPYMMFNGLTSAVRGE